MRSRNLSWRVGRDSRTSHGCLQYISVGTLLKGQILPLILVTGSSLGPINLSTLHYLQSLHFIINFRHTASHKPLAQLLALLSQISDRAKGNSVEKVSLECHFIAPAARHAGEKGLARIFQPLDHALSATLELGPHRRTTFAKLKEVEVVLSTGTISPADIRWIMARKGELLPSVEARGVTLTVKVGRSREETELLHQLREM